MPQSKRRSTKRNRREPIRRPIPTPPPGTVRTPSASQRRRFPSMLGTLGKMPIEALPLYAAMAITHEEIATSTGPVNACVPACHQLAGTLSHLGFSPELMAAHVQIQDADTGRTVEQIGVDTEPVIYSDHTTNGHMVLWAADFGRLADPTIIQAPTFLRAARKRPNLGLPTVIPIPGGREQLVASTVAGPRPPYVVAWRVFPQWAETLGGVLVGDLGDALEYGSLALAHTTLETIRALGQFRDDLGELDRYPKLSALLSQAEQLPPLPGEPPAAFVRVRQAAGMAPPA
jgi:hypothetical protein